MDQRAPSSLWRWLESSPEECRSDRNLFIDQTIFEAYQARLVPPTIRLYTWSEPVVSLGRLQLEERVRRDFPSENFVRRTTGGLAVEHDEDLTITIVAHDISLSLSGCNAARMGNVRASYFVLLEGMLRSLREIGIEAVTGQSLEGCSVSSDCFAHVGLSDVMDGRTNVKIMGSAQRRAHGFLLQQMSLRPLPGLDIHTSDFRALLKRHYQESLYVGMWQNETVITPCERERLKEL